MDVKVTIAKVRVHKMYKSRLDIKPNKFVNETVVTDFLKDLGRCIERQQQ